MLLAEQERILTSEQNLLTNKEVYSTNSGTLFLIHDYGNIVVPSGGRLVYFSAGIECTTIADPNPTGEAYFVLKVGGNAIAAKHISVLGQTGWKKDSLGCIVWLNAGTYDVSLYGATDNFATLAVVGEILSIHQYGFSIGITSFNDLATSAFQHYTAASTDISLTVNARVTPLGPLKQAVYALTITSDKAWGSGLSVQVDGVTIAAPDENGGTDAFGIYCYKLFVPLTVGVSHTITINLTSASAYASVVACPWILTTALRNGHSPINIDSPQLSTLYANLGSLFYDSTKDAYIGMPKGVSFGIGDFYAQGTTEIGILSFSYSFASVNVAYISFIVDGLGGCIENIGVDIA
jgi:hypothetical protein